MLPQERVGCLTVDGAVEESYEEDEPLHQKLIKAKLAKKQAAEDARLLEARLQLLKMEEKKVQPALSPGAKENLRDEETCARDHEAEREEHEDGSGKGRGKSGCERQSKRRQDQNLMMRTQQNRMFKQSMKQNISDSKVQTWAKNRDNASQRQLEKGVSSPSQISGKQGNDSTPEEAGFAQKYVHKIRNQEC